MQNLNSGHDAFSVDHRAFNVSLADWVPWGGSARSPMYPVMPPGKSHFDRYQPDSSEFPLLASRTSRPIPAQAPPFLRTIRRIVQTRLVRQYKVLCADSPILEWVNETDMDKFESGDLLIAAARAGREESFSQRKKSQVAEPVPSVSTCVQQAAGPDGNLYLPNRGKKRSSSLLDTDELSMRSDLTQHVRREETGLDEKGQMVATSTCPTEATVSQTVPGLQQCDIDGKFFATQKGLSHHTVHQSSSTVPAVADLVRCDICGNFYVDAEKQYAHKLREHSLTPDGKRIYRCRVCGVVQANLHLYKRHVSDHFVDGRLTCPLCPKQLTSMKQLTSHFRLHEGRVFPCDVCGKRMTRPEHLAEHKSLAHSLHTD